MERKPCYIDPISYDAICDFLNHIADHVGDTINEYHWREACSILLEIDNPEQKERRAKLLKLSDKAFGVSVDIDLKNNVTRDDTNTTEFW